MELFSKATQFCGSEPTAKAKSMLALSSAKMFFALENQLSEYRKRIEELFESHPDHDLFGSLPGAGPKLAPRLLGEIGDDRERFEGDCAKPAMLSRYRARDKAFRKTTREPSTLRRVGRFTTGTAIALGEDRFQEWPIRHSLGDRLVDRHRTVKDPASMRHFLGGVWLSTGSYA
jgi:hypothetical protein